MGPENSATAVCSDFSMISFYFHDHQLRVHISTGIIAGSIYSTTAMCLPGSAVASSSAVDVSHVNLVYA